MLCSVFLQAALLLVNLTSQSLPAGPVEDDQNVWQGPVVTDAEYRVNVYSNVPMNYPLKHQLRLQQTTFINTFSLFFRENKT